jgi:hypothetical protein
VGIQIILLRELHLGMLLLLQTTSLFFSYRF